MAIPTAAIPGPAPRSAPWRPVKSSPTWRPPGNQPQGNCWNSGGFRHDHRPQSHHPPVADLDRSVAFYKAAWTAALPPKWNERRLPCGWRPLAGPARRPGHPHWPPCRDTPMLPSMLIRMTLPRRWSGSGNPAPKSSNRTGPRATRSISSTRDGHKLELPRRHLASRLAAMKARPKPGQQVMLRLGPTLHFSVTIALLRCGSLNSRQVTYIEPGAVGGLLGRAGYSGRLKRPGF